MKKKLAVLLAAAMMMGAMTGCGSSAKTETTEAETKAEETTEAAENEDKFQSSILFCGSTSLYPIMSSLASSFTEKYVTWDKVDPSFSAENISIYVAPGGSGVGVSAAIDIPQISVCWQEPSRIPRWRPLAQTIRISSWQEMP